MQASGSGNCKICGGASLEVLQHTAKCAGCGVLLYYPYPASSVACYVSDAEKRSWYGRAAPYNLSNFAHIIQFVTKGRNPAEALSVLDYGGGGGQFAVVLKSLFPGAKVSLVDASDDSALEEWKPFNHRIRFADFGNDTTRFDLIFLNDVFEHLDDPVGTLRQLAGKLTERGEIFIDTPRQFWIYPVTRLFSRRLHAAVLRGTVSTMHLQIWSDRAFHVAVEAAGLEIVKFSKWAEFTMPSDFYLDNMQIRSRVLRAAAKLVYGAAELLLRNKIACVLARPTERASR